MINQKAETSSASVANLPFKICDLPNRGKAVVATQRLAANETVFQEPVFLSVKTFMILSGVIVLRRSKVEDLYEKLDHSDKRLYRSLHPMSESPEECLHECTKATNTSQDSLRHRVERCSEGTNSTVEDPPAPSSQQHREIWDKNGLHFCDDADVYWNRILHVAVCPTLLSIITGCVWAFAFRGKYIRSVLGAGVLFFAVLGPVSMRLFYFGSQALCLKASRVNHSCLPNATWQIDGQRLPMGGEPSSLSNGGDRAGTEAQRGNHLPATPKLTLLTKQAVAEGEELTIDYIPELGHLDAAERHNLLKQEYGFLCSCARCTARSLNHTEEEEVE